MLSMLAVGHSFVADNISIIMNSIIHVCIFFIMSWFTVFHRSKPCPFCILKLMRRDITSYISSDRMSDSLLYMLPFAASNAL